MQFGSKVTKMVLAKYKLKINDKDYEVEAVADTPLLWILRDTLGLTGSKYGCGIGVCGACTVLEGKEAVRSCQVTVEDAVGKKYVTIEGISGNGVLHPLQKAWIEQDVPQCGYCQTGQIMQAAALLTKKPKPTDADINEAMDQNICRCGTYQRIRSAIKEASK